MKIELIQVKDEWNVEAYRMRWRDTYRENIAGSEAELTQAVYLNEIDVRLYQESMRGAGKPRLCVGYASL